MTKNPTSGIEITVSVRTEYLEQQSDPAQPLYVFAYFITISNIGTVPVQLISRHWIIRDAHGQEKEVRGLGVVGHQPLLAPGAEFEYQSGTPLPTPQGTMRGTYQMVTEEGTQIEVPIPEFVLAVPNTLH